MSNIKNTVSPTTETGEVNRAQVEHRATWMGLIYDEMKKAGVDAEAILRRAVRRCGHLHGERLKKKCADPENAADFRNAFLSDLAVKTFNMDSISADRDNVRVTFHYCALMGAWQNLGFDDETCALLCDIAMDGDRGIAETLGLSLDINSAISRGNPDCQLHFHK
jgi:hypothetical protein